MLQQSIIVFVIIPIPTMVSYIACHCLHHSIAHHNAMHLSNNILLVPGHHNS